MPVDLARWRKAAEAGWDETLSAEDLLALLDELEAARAVVEAARSSDIAEEHGEHCDAFRCTCGHTAVADALKAYDAAKAGKAVE